MGKKTRKPTTAPAEESVASLNPFARAWAGRWGPGPRRSVAICWRDRNEYLDGVPSASTAAIRHTPSGRDMPRFAVRLGRRHLWHWHSGASVGLSVRVGVC